MTKPPLRLSFALCALLVLAIAAYATTVVKYTVTATIYNGGCTSTIDNGNCTIANDGSAVYSTGLGMDSELTPDSTLSSILYDQWNLGIDKTSSRSLYLTLIPITSASPTIFTGSKSFKATLYSRCFTSSAATTEQNWTLITSQTFTGGSDTTCAMRVLFTYNKVSYTLVMSPDQAASGQPATGWATVTCTSGTSPCTSWTDVPTPGVVDQYGNPVSNVANLYNGGSLPIGQYYLSFNVSLSHP